MRLTQNDNSKPSNSNIAIVLVQRKQVRDGTERVPLSLQELTRLTGTPGGLVPGE